MNKKTKNEMAKDKRSRLERATLPKGCGGPRMVVWTPLLTPDWSFWQDMPEVKLWQACALSLNLDPDSISPHYDGMGMMGSGLPSFRYENFPSAETWEEFEKRLRWAEANIHQQNAFCPNHINLSDFVMLVLNLSKPWEMPPALVALGRKTKAQISAPENDTLLNDDKENIKDNKQQSKTQDASWMKEARIQADIIYKKQKDLGCDPPKSTIADLIAKEFEKKDITVKGKRLNGGNIVRHALNTWNRPK
jgi:hypothetical protein